MARRTQLTYDDFAALPDDGKHYELLAGVLYVNPSPGLPHQHTAKRAFLQIREYFEGKALGARTFDRVTKAVRYLALGVEHYWRSLASGVRLKPDTTYDASDPVGAHLR
jgi:hypothetical protein